MNIYELRQTYAQSSEDYFDKQARLAKEEPGQFDTNLQYVIIHPANEARALVNAAQDPSNENHKEASKRYVMEFESNPAAVKTHFESAALAEYEGEKTATLKEIAGRAKKSAKSLLDLVKDFNNSGHKDAVMQFKSKYNSDPESVELRIHAELLKKAGFKSIPVRDIKYEASLSAGLKPANEYEASALESLTSLFKVKWSAVGYEGDAAVYEQFLKENITISSSQSNFKAKP